MIKTIQVDMSADKQTISDLLDINHELKTELNFFKSQFTTEQLKKLTKDFNSQSLNK